MARTYKRDNRGRFASGGTSSSGAKAKAAKPPTRGRNRITRDNAGRITSVGGQGATARGGRLKTAAGNKRGAVVAKMSLRRGGVVGKPKGLKPGALKGRGEVAKAKIRKVDLSASAFDKRAKLTERRARKAEKELAQVDRYNPANKRIRNKAYALRSAADSYASYVRRGAKGEFSAGYLFQSSTKASRRTTAPKLSRSEKAAVTRARNKAAKEAEQRRRWEQSRRYG